MGYSRPRYITICGGNNSSISPTDATVYYFGTPASTIGTTSAPRQIDMPKTGIIREIILEVYAGTAAGTNEAWTVSLTDGTATISLGAVSLNTNSRKWTSNNLNFPVTAGGYIQFITTTPTWATNPEGCVVYWEICIEVA